MHETKDFHGIRLRIIDQHVTKASQGPEPVRRREVRADAPQERVLPDPSRSVCDSTLQPLRRSCVLHILKCLGEFPAGYAG